jgi:hypothetical protein
MMTEDEAHKLVETMFDQITKVETVNGKPRATEEKTAAQIDAEEMEQAVDDLVRSWRRFREIERRSNDAALDPIHEIEWWRRVEGARLGGRTDEAGFPRVRPQPGERQAVREISQKDGDRRAVQG